jgi:hypothetical protein
VGVFDGVRSVAKGASKIALNVAPSSVQDAVAKIQARYESGRVDARRALEELGSLEEQALKAAATVLIFPFATIGAIRELYERVTALEKGMAERDAKIAALEARLRELEKQS